MNVMILTAHPDDLEISCTGYALMRKSAGDNVLSVVIAAARRKQKFPDGRNAACVRKKEAIASAEVLGISEPIFLGEKIGEIRYEAVLLGVRQLMRQHNTDLLLTHFPLDLHFDHALSGLVGMAIAQNTDTNVVFFESYNCYSFEPDETYDVVAYRETKAEALRCHVSQGFGNHTDAMVQIVERHMGVRKREA